MVQLKRVPEADSLQKEFRSFFTTADLVKFAKYLPTPAENEQELTWAFHFVRTMTPRPTTPSPGDTTPVHETAATTEQEAASAR